MDISAMPKKNAIFLMIACAIFSFGRKTESAQSIWKDILAPANPPLLRVRSFEQARGFEKYAVLDFVGLVEKHSYPAEEHKLTTDDGYHISIHRVPGSPFFNDTTEKKVALVQHGLLSSSDSWVIRGPQKDLVFMLADAGYDVWVGNIRGNSYSRSHERLNTSDPEFWKFSFHEHGMHDLSTSIDYILNYTGQKKLYYIAHSMGNLMVYVLLSTKPEYNEKLNVIVSLAPVAYWSHGVSPFIKFMIDRTELIMDFFATNKIYDLAPQSTINAILADTYCKDTAVTQPICLAGLFTVVGNDPLQLDTAILPRIFSHYPAGASIQTLVHFYQNIHQDSFQWFDYGHSQNFIRYKSKRPPVYDIRKVTTPVAVFYGSNDALAIPANTVDLCKRLPNVVTCQAVPFKLFNHVDFLWGTNAKILLYNQVMELIQHF